MATLGLNPRQVALLRLVSADEGRSQQALGDQLKLPPSRMVSLVDELEERHLLERRLAPDDRRVRALHLTDEGRATLTTVLRVSAEHRGGDDQRPRGDRARGVDQALSRIVTTQGLVPGVHPGIGDRRPKR